METETPNKTSRVRILIDGEARPMSPSGSVLRVTYGVDSSLVVDTNAPGVHVEHRVPEWQWTDDDVIVHAGLTAVRRGGRWHGKALPAAGVSDWAAERTLTERPLECTLLRYQHGEA